MITSLMRQELSKRIALLPLAFAAALLSACGGGGGGGGGGGNGGGGDGPPVTVSGRITFDRIPFDATLNNGLNPNAPSESPARHVVVEAIDASSVAQPVLASTTTDANGDYTLTVPGTRNVFIRAKAQMLKTGAAPTWDFSVKNNANGDALYALDGASFNTGTSNLTRNLRATSGWGGTSYTGTRAAAPFAILDTVYRAKELILTASANATFPALNLFWSTQNRPAGPFCPDNGNIGTSSYVTFGANGTDNCTPARPGVDGIYVLGDFGQGDTDEFDAHVIAHEFGHYFEDRFSRSDSIGGEHGSAERLDLRLAFGEGWGNAYSAMVQNDPAYRDSQNGMNSDFGFNLEADQPTNEGWFSEFSIGEVLFDVFDATADSGDNVALGFAPIYNVMTGPQVPTDAMTSIFTFSSALRSANSSSSAAINALLGGEQISASDAFGDSETNAGGLPSASVIPIYQMATFNTPITFCNRREAGTTNANKLGNRKLFRMDVPSSALVTIHVTGQAVSGTETAATDPDIYVFRRGSLVAFSEGEAVGQETLSQASLSAGTHIVEIYDFDIDGSATSRCMTASFTGIQ